jgi:hypothetical protein
VNGLCCLFFQERKTVLKDAAFLVSEKVTELETLLNDNLLRQQEELLQKLTDADVEADRCAG